MKPAENIKKLIKDVELDTNAQMDKAVLNDVLEALEESKKKKPAAIKPNRWRTIMKSRITKLAAAAVVIGAIGFFSFLGNGQTSLYAQAMRALQEAQSIHVLGKHFHDGQWETVEDIWFERDVGALGVFWSKGEKTKVIIEDGNSRWVYSPLTNTAIRSSEFGCQLIDEAAEILKAFENWEDRLVRTPSGDISIDNIPCQLYVLYHPELPDDRYSFWFDQDRRVRQLEHQQKLNEEWQIDQFTKIEYDLPVDTSIFDVDFGPDVTLLDPEKILGQDFDPAKALFSELISDRVIFAVHDLKKAQGGFLYLLSSIRPTEDTKRGIKSRRAKAKTVVPNYLSFEFLQSSVQVSGTKYPYKCIKIAEIVHNGMHIQGVLFIPKTESKWDVPDSKFEVSLQVRAIGKLADMLVEEGWQEISHGEKELPAEAPAEAPAVTLRLFKPIATLQLPGEEFLLEQITGQQYLKSSALEPAVQMDILILKPLHLMSSEEIEEAGFLEDNSLSRIETLGLTSKPSELTIEEYTDYVRSTIEVAINQYQSH